MFLSRKSARFLPSSPASDGFNGAGMFLSRKCLEHRRADSADAASMGPGCFYPGNDMPADMGGPRGELQWGRDGSIPEMLEPAMLLPEPSSFNGAGMFLSRKYPQHRGPVAVCRASMGPGCFYPGNVVAQGVALLDGGLQWGRDVSIPEIGRRSL